MRFFYQKDRLQCIVGGDRPVAGPSREALIDVLARRRVEGGESRLDVALVRTLRVEH